MAAPAPLLKRAENTPGFAVDPSYLRDGGVQYFYQLVSRDETPRSSTVQRFRPFDSSNRSAAMSTPPHVVVGRVVSLIDTDVSFFSEKQVRDVRYINQVARDFGITQNADGTYKASKTPSNTFRLSYFDRAALQSLPADSAVALALARMGELLPDAGVPDVLVLQENYDFARVLGWRTAELGVTWSAHYRVGEHQTMLHVCSMSYLHSTPPFFLGGDGRVLSEAIGGATLFIDNLRQYVKRPDGGTAPLD